MSARDVRGFSIIRYFIVGLSCVRAAYVHDVCVWFWRASRRSCQVGARCGHFGWRVLLTAALSCRPCTALLRHFGQRCLGLQRWVLLCFRSLVRQPLLCTTCACGRRASCDAAFRSWHGGHFGWRVLLTAALSCRPYRASLRRVIQRCLGLQLLDTAC